MLVAPALTSINEKEKHSDMHIKMKSLDEKFSLCLGVLLLLFFFHPSINICFFLEILISACCNTTSWPVWGNLSW